MKAQPKPITAVAGLLWAALSIMVAWWVTEYLLRWKGASLTSNGGIFVFAIDLACFVFAVLALCGYFVGDLEITDEHIVQPGLFKTTVIHWTEARSVYMKGHFWYVEGGGKQILFAPESYDNGNELIMVLLKHARQFQLVDI